MLHVVLSLLLQAQQPGPALPRPAEGDFVIRDFRFDSGETLPALRLHYRTYGTPTKDAHGLVTNAVLVMHGTGGPRGQGGGRRLPGAAVPVAQAPAPPLAPVVGAAPTPRTPSR